MNTIKKYEFNEKLSEAQEGEKIIIDYLLSLPDVIEVQDVRDLPEYRNKDIDFLVHIYDRKNKNFFYESIEVKTDKYYRTGNIFAETVSNINKNTKGCFVKTECDYMYYLFFPQNILYILPMKKVKKWFFDNYDDFITKITSTCNVDGVVLYRSLGKLIPRERISKEVPGVRIINLNVKNKKIQD